MAELCVKEIQKKWDNVRTREQEAYTIPWNGIEQKIKKDTRKRSRRPTRRIYYFEI